MTMTQVRILIVDDEPHVRDGLRDAIDGSEYEIETVPDGETEMPTGLVNSPGSLPRLP